MANFDTAVEFVLANEDSTLSGKVTSDAGGRTRFGIAEKFHPNLGDAFFTGPPLEALEQAEAIYRHSYWFPISGDVLSSDAVAAKILDMVVNMGLHQGIILVQRALNSLGAQLFEDGCLGERTLAAIESVNPATLLTSLCEICGQFYRHRAAVVPEDEKYLAGWLNRAARIPVVSVAELAEQLSS